MEFRRLVFISLPLLALTGSGCQNPLGDSNEVAWKGSNQVDSSPVLTPFTATFNFDTASDYEVQSGAQVSAGVATLARRDVTDDSTAGGGSDLNFSHRLFADGTLNISSDKITMASGSSAQFTSRIMDNLGPIANWSSLQFISSLPFGKEVATSAEAGYGAPVANFSNGLVGLWHLNEPTGTATSTSVKDASPTLNHGTPVGGVSFGNSGKLLKAAGFDGSDDVISLAANGFPTAAAARTTAIWFRKDTGSGNRALLAYGNNASGELWEMMVFNNNLILHAHGGGYDTLGVPAPVSENVWTHAALTYSGGVVTVYVDGVKRGTAAMTLNTGTSFFRIGGPGYFAGWKGDLDEAAVWNRELSETEVAQLYRRGANRVKFQVRTCMDSTCSTNPAWVGPDATSSTYFSEFNNNTQAFASSGDVLASPFAIPWTEFASASPAFSTWFASNKIYRYAQYRVVMESDSNTSFPDLHKVSFAPTGNFLTTKPGVQSKLSTAPEFAEVHSLSMLESGTCAGIRYEIGNDENQFYSWSGNAWISSAVYASANPKSTLETLTRSEWKLLPVGTGKLFVRAFFDSDGTSTCQLDQITVQGAKK